MQQSPAGVHRPPSHRRRARAWWAVPSVLLLLLAGVWLGFALLPGGDTPPEQASSPPGQGVVAAADEALVPGPGSSPVEAVTQEREPWSPLSTMRIMSVSPAQGSTVGGEAVVVSGEGFVDGVAVTFGTRASPEVERLNDTTLRVMLPPGLPGAVPVAVSAPGEVTVSEEGLFSYVDQLPRVVMAIRPSLGATAGGTPVTIVGTGFMAGARVTIGGQRATDVEVVDSTRITALTPAREEALVDVVVRNPGFPAAILRGAFEYVGGPTVTEVSPGEVLVSGGDVITVRGSGFGRGIAVSVNGLPATGVRVLGPEELTAITPVGVLGPATVAVTMPGQPSAELMDALVFVLEPTAPVAPEQSSAPAPMMGVSPEQSPADGAPAPDTSVPPAG